MEITVTPKPETSEAELVVEITPAEFKPYVERAARSLSKAKPLKGFRPGKATLKAAVEAFGQERVVHEALDRAVPHFFVQAVLDQGVEALGQPRIAINESSLEQGTRFTAIVAVLPKVTLNDVATITVEQRIVSVSDEDVTKELTYLAKMRSTFKEVLRPAKAGDTVTVDFKVSRGGSPVENGESKNHPIHVGEGHFIPEIEQQLIGISAGQQRTFAFHFPADYREPELRGTEASIWIKAHSVQERVLPELNDEFAQKLGKFDNFTHLRGELKKNLQAEREQKERDRLNGALAEKLAEQATFGTLPEVLIEREIDHRLQEFAQMLSYQSKTVDDYLTTHQKTLPDVREEMREASTRAVKVGLALRTYAEQEKIVVSDEEVEERVSAYLNRLAATQPSSDDVDRADVKDTITSTLRNQKTLEHLASRASVNLAPTKEVVADPFDGATPRA